MNQKKQVILQAWSPFLSEQFSDLDVIENVDENGWIYRNKLPRKILQNVSLEWDSAPGSVRPNSLSGIENNFGWISTNEFDNIKLPPERTLIIGISRVGEHLEAHMAVPGDEKYIFSMWSHYQVVSKQMPVE